MPDRAIVKVFCGRCKSDTNHEIVNSVSYIYTPENTPGMQIDFAKRTWEIVRCCGCEEYSFREVLLNSEDFDPKTGELEELITLYPSRGGNTLPLNTYYNLPSNIRVIYREVIDCYNRENYILCAGGLRALIEGICAEKKIDGGHVEKTKRGGGTQKTFKKNLQGKINGLAEKGLLTVTHAGILHEHRFLGNDALHELKKPNLDDLTIAINILEHTIENIFELPDKGARLAIKRVRKKIS